MSFAHYNNKYKGRRAACLAICKTVYKTIGNTVCNTATRLAVCAALLAAPLAQQSVAQDFTLGFADDNEIRELTLAIGKTQIIRSARALEQVIVGNANIADVQLLNDRQFLIMGRTAGTTNLAFRDTNNRVIAVMNVVVGYDMDSLKRNFHEALPGEPNIEVRSANGKIVLSGQVGSAATMDVALQLARSYAAEDGEVINLMQVGGGQQVMLEARIAEVKRNALRNLGIETYGGGTAGDNTVFGFLTGDPLQTAFGGGLALETTSFGMTPINVLLQALEQEGSAKVLAEPNIVALSGHEANFLVGGEFPVPIAQTGNSNAGTITIQWKEFGVGLRFTPTVLSDRRINMQLITEVSDIDFTTGTSVMGTSIPGLRTRRAGTTIELGDGNSFAIAGLLQSDITTVVREFPGLGNIPILGALFRSTEFQQAETELVIIITPRLVQSSDGRALTLPTDGYRPPNRSEQYLEGRVEGRANGAPAAGTTGSVSPVQAPALRIENSLEGPSGHQF
jgi:pilus assembly protein CpaC